MDDLEQKAIYAARDWAERRAEEGIPLQLGQAHIAAIFAWDGVKDDLRRDYCDAFVREAERWATALIAEQEKA